LNIVSKKQRDCLRGISSRGAYDLYPFDSGLTIMNMSHEWNKTDIGKYFDDYYVRFVIDLTFVNNFFLCTFCHLTILTLLPFVSKYEVNFTLT
jgi:hypothetical protein